MKEDLRLQSYRTFGEEYSWGRILTVAGCVVAVVAILAIWLLNRGGSSSDAPPKESGRTSTVRGPAPDYEGHQEATAVPASVVVGRVADPPRPGNPGMTAAATRRPGRAKEDQLLAKARDAGIGTVQLNLAGDRGGKGDEGGKGISVASADDPDGTDFVAGAHCQVNAGTPIRAKLTSAISTAHGGQVIALVDQDVWASDDPNCRPIPLGSKLYGMVGKADIRGQKVALITFTKLTRPAPRNDTIKLEAPASDRMGRAGMPGEVESYFWSQTALVIAATVVDLGSSLLTAGAGPWGVVGNVLMGNADSPLNKVARDRLDLPPTILVDPLEMDGSLTVVTQEHINADDFGS